MITGADINDLIDILQRREACLYHACQLIDFESYLKIGAVASAGLLAQRNLPYHLKRPRGIPNAEWVEDSLDCSLSDHGMQFARSLSATPDPDGPIVLQIRPDALRQASAVAILMPNRRQDASDPDSITELTVGDVQYLFKYTPESPFPERTFTRSREELEDVFDLKLAGEPRLTCKMPDRMILLEHVSLVLVDNYLVFARQLRDWVHEIQRLRGCTLPIQRRYAPADVGGNILAELAKQLLAEPSSVVEKLRHHKDQRVRLWMENITANGQEDQFQHFAQALLSGTLRPLKAQVEQLRQPARGETADSQAAQTLIPRNVRELIDKLQAEHIPLESIARITDIPESALKAYIDSKPV